MNISSTRRTPSAVPPSSPHTSQAPTSQVEGSTPVETLTWAANDISNFTITGAAGVAGAAAVAATVFELTGQESLAIGVGLVAGGAAGLMAGQGLVKGLDGLGAKLDKNQPQRGALLLKTALLGVTGTLVAGAVSDINQGMNTARAFSAIGAI